MSAVLFGLSATWGLPAQARAQPPVAESIARLYAQPSSIEQLRRTALSRRDLVGDHARYRWALALRRGGHFDRAEAHLQKLGLVKRAVIVDGHELRAWSGHNGRGFLELSSPFPPAPAGNATLRFVLVAHRPIHVAALRVGLAGHLRLAVDGKTFFEGRVASRAALDQVSVGLRIPRGEHDVEVRARWDHLPCELSLRLTGPRGGPVRGATLTASLRAVQRQIPPRRLASLSNRRIDRVDDGLDGLTPDLRASYLKVFDPEGPVRKGGGRVSEALRAAAQEASGVLAARAWTRVAEHELTRGSLPAALEAAHEAVRRTDPGGAEDDGSFQLPDTPSARQEWMAARAAALETRAAIAFALERPLAALEDLASLRARPRAAALRARIGTQVLGEGPVALLRLDPWLDAPLPEARPALEALADLASVEGDPSRMRRAARAVLEIDATHAGAAWTLVEAELNVGSSTAALRALSNAIRAHPSTLGFRLRKAAILGERHPRGALALLRRAHPRFFRRPALLWALAERAEETADESTARWAYDLARSADPHDPRVSALGARLRRRPLDVFGPFRLDPSAVLDRPPVSGEARAGAAILARRELLEAELGGRWRREAHLLIRLADEATKERLRHHRIAYAPSRESVLIRAARRWRKGQAQAAAAVEDVGLERAVERMILDQRAVDVRFDDLAPGDVIELDVVIDGRGGEVFGRFLGDVLIAQNDLPQADFRYVVNLPRSMMVRTWTRGLEPPKRHLIAEPDTTRQLWVWSAPHLPALVEEPHAPPFEDRSAIAAISPFRQWHELARWYAERWRTRLKPSAALEKVHAGLPANLTPTQSLRALHALVVRRIRYLGLELGLRGFIPDSASTTWERGWGDCKDQSTLLATLLREAGLDAHLVLLRTRARGSLPADAVSLWSFDHALLYVPELKLYVDPTEPFAAPGYLPPPDLGADALVVTSTGGAGRTRLPDPPAWTHRQTLTATVSVLKGTAEAVMTATLRAFGARAAPLRAELEVASRRRERWQRRLNRRWPGVALERVEARDPRHLGGPAQVQWRARGPSSTLPLSVLAPSLVEDLAPLETRQTELRVPLLRWDQTRLHVQGETLEPRTENIRGAGLRFHRRVDASPQGATVTEQLVLEERAIAVEAYPTFRRTAVVIDRALAEKLLPTQARSAQARSNRPRPVVP